MLKKIACIAVLGAVASSNVAFAGTDTGTMNISATISASCTITTSDVAFGSLTSTNGGDLDVPSSASVTCASDSPFNIGIDNGLNASGFQRRMASGGNFLNYEVYVDAPGVNAFGPISTYGTSNNFNSPSSGNNGTTVVPIYARLPQQTTPPSGVYSDTLTVTVNY